MEYIYPATCLQCSTHACPTQVILVGAVIPYMEARFRLLTAGLWSSSCRTRPGMENSAFSNAQQSLYWFRGPTHPFSAPVNNPTTSFSVHRSLQDTRCRCPLSEVQRGATVRWRSTQRRCVIDIPQCVLNLPYWEGEQGKLRLHWHRQLWQQI